MSSSLESPIPLTEFDASATGVEFSTYWVRDGDDQDDFYKHMTEIRHRHLADPGPAATAVRVAGLAVEGLVIEIEAVAVVPEQP